MATKQLKLINKHAESILDEDAYVAWMDKVHQQSLSKSLTTESLSKTKKDTDPDKPKRPISAFLLFCSANRADVKSELGDGTKLTDVTKELGARWTKLKESSDASDVEMLSDLTDQAAQAKKQYDVAVVEYSSQSAVVPVEKKVKKEAAPKKESSKKESKKESKKTDDVPKEKASRKITGYSVYSKEQRILLTKENPDSTKKEITEMVQQAWKDLDHDDQEEYNVRASEESDD